MPTPLNRAAYERELQLAADTPAKASTHEPVGHGGKNWITAMGAQLPAYIQHIANDLKAKHGESQAIQMAIGIVKNWASGKGNVKPEVRAAAAKAVAEWEALKAKNAAKKGASLAASFEQPVNPEGLELELAIARLDLADFHPGDHPRDLMGKFRVIASFGHDPQPKSVLNALERSRKGDVVQVDDAIVMNHGDAGFGVSYPDAGSSEPVVDTIGTDASGAVNALKDSGYITDGYTADPWEPPDVPYQNRTHYPDPPSAPAPTPGIGSTPHTSGDEEVAMDNAGYDSGSWDGGDWAELSDPTISWQDAQQSLDPKHYQDSPLIGKRVSFTENGVAKTGTVASEDTSLRTGAYWITVDGEPSFNPAYVHPENFTVIG